MNRRLYIQALWVGALALLLGTGCGLIDTMKARQLAREGNSLYHKAEYHQAIEKYTQALKLDAETPNIHLNLGYSYFSIYDPQSESELDRRAARQAVFHFGEHLRRHPEDENTRVFEIKTLLTAAPGDPELADRALQTFTQMIEKNPRDHEARQYLINLFIDCKRYDDALRFFQGELEGGSEDIETMKILAIIADKSDRVQEAVDWYWRRAEAGKDQQQRAVLFYEIGTYAWNLLHYQPDRVQGIAALKLCDQGIEACRRAMKLKEKYAEAMIYANLLYLKRALFEPEEVGHTWDQTIAFELRVEAGKILSERKKTTAEAEKDGM